MEDAPAVVNDDIIEDEAAPLPAPPAAGADEAISDEEREDALAPEDYPAPLQLDKGKGRADDAAPSDNMPWVEKVRYARHWVCAEPVQYRPVSLDDVVSHRDIVATSASRRGRVR